MNPIEPIAGWTFLTNKTELGRWQKSEPATYPGIPKEYPCWGRNVFNNETDTTTDFLYHNETAYMLAAFVGERKDEPKFLIRRTDTTASGQPVTKYHQGHITVGNRKKTLWSDNRANAWAMRASVCAKTLKDCAEWPDAVSEPL